MPTAPLTDKQSEILDFIKKFIEENGWAPTLREMAEEMEVTHQAVFFKIRELLRKGYIDYTPNISRSIKIIV